MKTATSSKAPPKRYPGPFGHPETRASPLTPAQSSGDPNTWESTLSSPSKNSRDPLTSRLRNTATTCVQRPSRPAADVPHRSPLPELNPIAPSLTHTT